VPDIHFGNANFTGGVQNFGGQNKVEQTNTYYLGQIPRDEIDAKLAAIVAAHPDPARAAATVSEIGQLIDHRRRAGSTGSAACSPSSPRPARTPVPSPRR
jgi:hypothetical protein